MASIIIGGIGALFSIGQFIVSLIGVAGPGVAVVSGAKTLNQLFSFSSLSAFNRFDSKFAEMIILLFQVFDNLRNFSKWVLLLSSFLAIVFYSFKLLLGTIEIKKVFAESIYKTVIVTITMLTFPSIISSVYQYATYLGVEITGGAEVICNQFVNLANKTNSIYRATEKAIGYLRTTTQSSIENSKTGMTVASPDFLDAFIQLGMSSEQAEAWADAEGIKITDTGTSAAWKAARGDYYGYTSGSTTYRNSYVSKVEGTDVYSYKVKVPNDDEIFKNAQYQAEKQAYDSLIASNNTPFIKQQIAQLLKLSEILTGYDPSTLDNLSEEEKKYAPSFSNLLTNGEEVIKNIFGSPYIEGSSTLSAGSMFYIALVTSELLKAGTLSHLDENNISEDSDIPNMSFKDAFESKDKTLLVSIIDKLLVKFLYQWGIIIAVIFVMCEYYLTIFEYLLVCAMSSLMIPLFFIDATKNFASNILKTLFSYFFKILVTSFMCFFVLSYFLVCSGELFTATNVCSTSNVLYYIFILALGLTLAKSSGRIAGAVISGNPNMGLGDLVNEFRSMSGAVRTAGRELQKGLHGLESFAKTAGKELGGAAEVAKGAGDVKALARQNALDSFNAARKEKPYFDMSESDINKAVRKMGREEARAYWGQALVDRGYKALHGGQSDAGLLQKGEDGRYSVASKSSGYAIAGKKYLNGDQWLDYTGSTAVKRNQEILQERTKDKLDKIIRKNSGEELSTDDYKGSKTDARPDLPSESGREA